MTILYFRTFKKHMCSFLNIIMYADKSFNSLNCEQNDTVAVLTLQCILIYFSTHLFKEV